ncbi:MAG TPA: 5'-methylthioadenosine/S-adenosylhomocysteine nucleosidase [Acidimicrobiia bacterium]
MSPRSAAVRVGVLAPMVIELQPVVARLGMEGDGSLYRGLTGDGVEVIAMLTNIGMANGASAATRMLDHDVDHVMVVGIAGGVDQNVLSIGDVVVPEAVVRRGASGSFRPAFLGAIAPKGTLSCGDDLITDPAVLARMGAQGVIAVDMETAAVAEVCHAADVPWSVFRGISDFAGEGLISDELFALTQRDGSADPDDVAKYLEEHPDQLPVLKRLAHDTQRATEAAAAAAVEACAALVT